MLLSTGDVCDVLCLTNSAFKFLCKVCGVQPARGGTGKGNPARFTPVQVIGLIVASALRNSPRGCAPAWVGRVVEAFRRIPQEELSRLLRLGHTHFLTVNADGEAVIVGQEYAGPDGVNVETIYRGVLREIRKLRARPVSPKGGQRRGLASRN